MLGLLALILGLVLGLFWKANIPPVYWTYIALLILVIIDSLMYALAMYSRKIYDQRMVYLSLIANFILASCITALGDQIGLQLYLCPFFAFGVRIFQNFGRALAAFIENVDEYNARRKFDKYQKNLNKTAGNDRKKRGKNKLSSEESAFNVGNGISSSNQSAQSDLTIVSNAVNSGNSDVKFSAAGFSTQAQVQRNKFAVESKLTSDLNDVNIINKTTNGGATKLMRSEKVRSYSNNYNPQNISAYNKNINNNSKSEHSVYQDNYSYYQDLDNKKLPYNKSSISKEMRPSAPNRDKKYNQINSSFLQKDSTFRFEAIPENFKDTDSRN